MSIARTVFGLKILFFDCLFGNKGKVAYICSAKPIITPTMKRIAIVNAIKQKIHELPIKLEARLYGSEARGEAHRDSDIDLLILIDKPQVDKTDENAVFEKLYPIELQSGVAINPVIMPRSQWGAQVTPFYINVENEGIVL